MTVHELLRILWSGKYLVLGSLVLVTAGTFAYLQQQVAVYEATTTVAFTTAENVSPDDDSSAEVTVDTDPELVDQPEVLQDAADRLDDGTTARELADVEASYDPELMIMSITSEGDAPAVAAQRADAVAAAYVDYLPTVVAAEIESLDERAVELRGELDSVQASLRTNRNDPLATAERDAIISQYESLLAQRSALMSIGAPAEVQDPASPGQLVGLPSVLILALGALTGLVAGVGIALARRALDVSVQTPADAAAIAEAPVLADLYGVPEADRVFRQSGQLPVASRVANPFTESIRELRTAVTVSLGEQSRTVVVVTATDPHAPRAFIAANLAASFALSGRTTIALAGDLRRPELADLLPEPQDEADEPGHEGLLDHPRRTRVPNLRLMRIQHHAMDPADYLATNHVRSVVERMRAEASVVVVDAPPVLAAADATILGGYADGVVLVASSAKTAQEVLREAAERLRINHVALAGVALAGVRNHRKMAYASTYGADSPAEASAEEPVADVVAASPSSAVSPDAVGPPSVPPARDAPGDPRSTPPPGRWPGPGYADQVAAAAARETPPSEPRQTAQGS